jgi:hypothetical protein
LAISKKIITAAQFRCLFKEAGPQLLLQAFLQRIVNGGGRMRADMLIVWPVRKPGEVEPGVNGKRMAASRGIYLMNTGAPFTVTPLFFRVARISSADMLSSSKVMLIVCSCVISCFITPAVVLRIEPILWLSPQEAQPGIFICTILSAA